MFFEERSHVFGRAAVRTKDRSELQTDVQPNKFEFRARYLSTNQIAAVWRAFVQVHGGPPRIFPPLFSRAFHTTQGESDHILK